MFRLLTVLAAFVGLMVSLAATPAKSEKRVALVVGNDAYQILRPQLANAAADARDFGRALRDSGFETTVKTNVKRRELYQLIDAFGAAIAASPDTVGLFYYAGHGVQANGKNYLVPVDSELASEGDLEAEAVDAGKVLRAMDEAHNNVNIVILDACRDNPLPKARSLTRGLATMQAPRGTFIGYAAAPGQTAQDGEQGGNGVFTGALVEHLRDQGTPIEEVFKHVIAGVQAKTGGKQVPWMESSLQGNFYFTAPVNVTVTPAPQTGRADDRELVFWESIKGSTDPADFADFLKRYPDSDFASIAQRRMVSLRPAAAPAPSASPAPAATTAPVPQADAAEIARSVQSELKRVGCYGGAVDGVWGPGTAAAIQQFNQRTGKRVDTTTASLDSVAAIKDRADRVCPPRPVAKPQPREGRDEANSAYQAPAPSPNSRGAGPYTSPGSSPYGSQGAAPSGKRDCFTFNGQQVCN